METEPNQPAPMLCRRELLCYHPNWTPREVWSPWQLPSPCHTQQIIKLIIFAWESTYKNFSFCLLTELHVVHALPKYESSYMPALACCVQLNWEWLFNTIVPPQELTFKNLILMNSLWRLETRLHLLFKINLQFTHLWRVCLNISNLGNVGRRLLFLFTTLISSVPHFCVVERKDLLFPVCGCI